MLGYRHAAFLLLLCLAGYATILGQRGYVHDDAHLVGGNVLLDAGLGGLEGLLGKGIWEAADGSGARVYGLSKPVLYRPLLMLTFLAQNLTTGRDARPLRAANLLLHAAACWLLLIVLRGRLPAGAALAAAAAFAVLPTHVEAVAAVTGRSELLSAVLLLGAWLLLDRRSSPVRTAGGVALFTAALFVKEHALLFPILVAASDWTFDGAKPWSRGRRGVHAALLGSIALYLVVRLALAGVPFSGGVPYFGDRLTAALTVARFAFARYLWPSLTGAGLCPDFARPLIPDARPGSPWSWPPLLGLAALYAFGLWALLARRARWAFWLCAPSVFLLPTIHVLTPLNEIGAQRFLYLPSLGLAAGLGVLWTRARATAPRTALASGLLLLAGGAWACAAYARAWRGGIPYYERVLACNPVSARARAAYGMELILAGRAAEGQAQFAESIRLAPGLALPYYNLARLAWERGDAAETERRIAEALERDPTVADAWVLAGLVAEKRGRFAGSEAALRRALALSPWNPAANFNLARLELASGRAAEAIPHLRAFARYAPRDPDAAWALRVSAGGRP
ncbi:MAG: tetratricopeptide repeat protein [Elusimicrobia bacterium]|nr:tetratricopeptide repeat protein [Elusimicrobiota bacterium]